MLKQLPASERTEPFTRYHVKLESPYNESVATAHSYDGAITMLQDGYVKESYYKEVFVVKVESTPLFHGMSEA